MTAAFIVVDGIDGAGCGTHTALLRQHLEHKHDVLTLQYPVYKRATGTFLKQFLNGEFNLTVEEQFFAYCMDMARDWPRIREHVQNGGVVLADRYFTSTLAYQSVNGLEQSKMLHFAKLFAIPAPTLAVYLNCTVETAYERKQAEKDELDRYEQDVERLEQVKAEYEDLVKNQVFAETWETVDAEPGIQTVQKHVQTIVKEHVS